MTSKRLQVSNSTTISSSKLIKYRRVPLQANPVACKKTKLYSQKLQMKIIRINSQLKCWNQKIKRNNWMMTFKKLLAIEIEKLKQAANYKSSLQMTKDFKSLIKILMKKIIIVYIFKMDLMNKIQIIWAIIKIRIWIQ
jgi:hypothetical protein